MHLGLDTNTRVSLGRSFHSRDADIQFMFSKDILLLFYGVDHFGEDKVKICDSRDAQRTTSINWLMLKIMGQVLFFFF